MLALIKKEFNSFFSSLTGYLILALFVLLLGLFLWVFENPFNMFAYGFADLSLFFALAPWVFLFFIPALTMKSFAEEKRSGTLELLLIKPLPLNSLVLGKFLGAFLLCILVLVPTLIYVAAISALGVQTANFDVGVVVASYVGLILLMAAFTAMGIFASSVAQNQLMGFIVALALCFLFFYGFDGFASLFSDGKARRFVAGMGAKDHFEHMGRGVIDTKDVVYFMGVALFFGFLTRTNLKTDTRS